MSGDLAVWMCTRETGRDGRVFDEPFIATNRAYVDAHPFHDWASLYSQATVDTLRAQLEAAEADLVNLRSGNIAYSQQVNELIGRAGNSEARAEAAEAEVARWKQIAHHSSAGCSHRCRDCGHPYTPADGESEDCPLCGSDGRTKEAAP